MHSMVQRIKFGPQCGPLSGPILIQWTSKAIILGVEVNLLHGLSFQLNIFSWFKNVELGHRMGHFRDFCAQREQQMKIEQFNLTMEVYTCQGY